MRHGRETMAPGLVDSAHCTLLHSPDEAAPFTRRRDNQCVSNGGTVWAARQLWSKPLSGWSRKFDMIVAKQGRDQRAALCPMPGNTRFVEFFNVFAASAA